MTAPWSEGVKGYPCGAHVRSLVADEFFVQVGTVGRIVGREYPAYPAMNELLITVHWLDSDTKTTVPCEAVERIEQPERGVA